MLRRLPRYFCQCMPDHESMTQAFLLWLLVQFWDSSQDHMRRQRGPWCSTTCQSLDIGDPLLLDWLTSLGLMSATDEDALVPTCRCSQLPDVLRFVLNQM